MIMTSYSPSTKLRFAGGTGVDDLMDELTAKYVSDSDFRDNPRTEAGIKLNSLKELYYYKLFRQHFPLGTALPRPQWHLLTNAISAN
jgi:hypothetical protein